MKIRKKCTYLDNAATTFFKPKEVVAAATRAMKNLSANPGRGGHKFSFAASDAVYKARETVADFFCTESATNIIFCNNTTHALNLAIKGVAKPGGHIIISGMEHNSVLRPCHKLMLDKVCDLSIAPASCDGTTNPADVEALIRKNTCLIVCSHASNVCGTIAPIAQIGDVAKKHNIPFLVDAAQSAGVVPINLAKTNIDMLAFAGHKGLYGPMGTGGLYVRDGVKLSTIIEGGTGSLSEDFSQPDFFPDRMESGTLNVPAIVGLGVGVEFLKSFGAHNIAEHEQKLTSQFLQGLKQIKGVKIVGVCDETKQTAVVAFNIEGMDCVFVSNILDEKYNIAVRSGLHCAAVAHQSLGTLRTGLVRASFGFFNTPSDVCYALFAIEEISKTAMAKQKVLF